MFGNKVHESVINAGDTVSGITIHYVNHEYDAGQVIFQALCNVSEEDTADTLAQKIHGLEYVHFPEIISKLILA